MKAAVLVELAVRAADVGDWDEAAALGVQAGDAALDEGDEVAWEASRRLARSVSDLRAVRAVCASRTRTQIRAAQVDLFPEGACSR